MRSRCGQSRQLRNADEAEAARLEPRDQLPERGDGFVALATAVVEHNDAAATALWRSAADDRGDPPTLPILRVVVGQDDQIALACHTRELPFLTGVDGVR